MKYFLQFSALFLFLSVTSCKQNSQPAEDTLVKQYMDGITEKHDIIMPKMATLNSLKRQIESHNHGDAGDILAGLSKAEEVMNNWMSKYQPNLEGTVEQKRKYYDKEYQKLVQMEGIFEEIIADAKSYIGNHQH